MAVKTVLIIEDDPGNMQAFCVLLSAQGYNVREATSGNEALDASLRYSGPIDFILCDVTLPDISGTHVAVELLKSHPEAAILFVSGTPRENWSDCDLNNFSKLPHGSADFLEKPFLPSTLQRRVEELLSRHCALVQERNKNTPTVGRLRPS